MLPLDYIKNIKISIVFRPVDELYTVLLQPEDFVLVNPQRGSVSPC